MRFDKIEVSSCDDDEWSKCLWRLDLPLCTCQISSETNSLSAEEDRAASRCLGLQDVVRGGRLEELPPEKALADRPPRG